MANNQIDLFSIFNQVSKALKDNKTSLNEADSYNHDHGDHMTEIFEVITQAMKEKKNADPADQLEYAAKLLRGQSKSGSGKLYAEGLGSAAKQITGKELNAGTIMSMLQTIMNAGQPAPQQQEQSGGGLLGSLLGSLAGSQQDEGLDLGDLIGALTGSAPSSSNDQGGMDLGDLVGAGMKILNAAQASDNNLESIAGALLSGTTMGESDYRKQSGQLVTSTVLKALTSMLKK
jgi:hypothetical protein